METCLLCLELRHDSVDCIYVTSKQWEEDNIEQLIEQHFWPMESIKYDSWICGACWHILNEFHQFYIRVEDAHVDMAITMNKVESPQQQPVVESDTADFEDLIDKELSKQTEGINIIINLNSLPNEQELSLNQLAQSNIHEDCSNLEEALSMEQAVTNYFHENVKHQEQVTQLDHLQGHINEFDAGYVHHERGLPIDLIQIDKLEFVTVNHNTEMPTDLIKTPALEGVGGNGNTELPTCPISSQSEEEDADNDNKELPTYPISSQSEDEDADNDNKELPTYPISTNQSEGVAVGNGNTDLATDMETRKYIEEGEVQHNHLDQLQRRVSLSDQIHCKPELPIDHIQEEEQSGNGNDDLDLVESGGLQTDPVEPRVEIPTNQFVEEDNKFINDISKDEELMTDDEEDNRICRMDPLEKPLIAKMNAIPKTLFGEHNVNTVLLECIEDICQNKPEDILQETCNESTEESQHNETDINVCNEITHKKSQTNQDNCEELEVPIDYPSDCKTTDSYSDNESLASRSSSMNNDEFLAKHFKITCSICQKAMLTFSDLLKHFLDVHKRRGYAKCCDRQFKSRGSLVEHIRWHCEPHNYKCKYCGKLMSTKRCLNLHEKHIHEKTYNKHKCDICQKSFASVDVLKVHKLRHLSDDEKKFHCDQCSKKFGSNTLLFNHIRSVHMAKYIKICDICGKKLRNRYDFENHVLAHKGLPVPQVTCDACGIKLVNSKALKRHQLIQHPEGGKKEYKCHICSKVSDTLLAHRGHIQYKHEMTPNYKCKICGKGFKKLFTLNEHMAGHTKTPLYSCPYCPKTFNSNGNMHSHRKSHHPQEWLDDCRKKYSGKLPPNLIPPSTLHKHIGYPMPEDDLQ